MRYLVSDLVLVGFDRNSANLAVEMFINNKLTKEENIAFIQLLNCGYIPGEYNSPEVIRKYNGVVCSKEDILIKLLVKIRDKI